MKYRLSAVLIILFAITFPFLKTEGQAAGSWKAGASSIDITPSMPMWMAGYGSRTRPGNEVALPLQAKALALQDANGRTLMFISADILGIPAIVRKTVEKKLADEYKLDPSYLVMCASHNHSGPEVRSIQTFLEKRDPARTEMVNRYRAELINKLIKVAGEAFANLSPAEVAYGKATAGFAMNRRMDYSLPKSDPRYGKTPNNAGPVDHEVPILRVTGKDGKLLAVLFSYACHATTVGNYTFHGDYPGFAQHFIEEAHPGAIALFIQGCAADQNPHPRNDMVPGLTGLDLARLHGQTLFLAVEAALNAYPESLQPKLQSILETVPLNYNSVPSRDELVKQAASKNTTESENAQVLLEWLDRDGQLPSAYSYPVQAIKFGGALTMVVLASEVVVDYSLRLKHELPGPTWVSAYCNDFLGYIPSRRIWEEGGYEGGQSLTFSAATLYRGAAHPGIWRPDIEEVIISKVHEITGKLNGNGK
jgi:hypothetical protein